MICCAIILILLYPTLNQLCFVRCKVSINNELPFVVNFVMFYLGLVVQSGALIFFGFWIFHLFNLLYSLMFPFRSQHLIKSKQFRRNVHFIEVLIVLMCGLLPSIIIVSTSGYQYIGFPPVCTNEIPEVLFYTLIFPISIEAIFGLCMLLISLWILRKVTNQWLTVHM